MKAGFTRNLDIRWHIGRLLPALDGNWKKLLVFNKFGDGGPGFRDR